ncbi:MAG: HlyD family secretion protein [Rickettsiales bacterium]
MELETPTMPDATVPPRMATPRAKPRRSKRGIVLVVLALLVLGAVVYWFLHRGEQSTDDATIEGQVVAMAPKLSGYVVALNVTDNQRVVAGDVIAQIDPRDYQLALDKSRADLASAEARLAGGGRSYASTKISAPLSVESAQAQVDAANAEWERSKKELARLKKLGDAARSRSLFDQAESTEKSARSSLADAQARLKSARVAPNTIASAAASVKELEAALDTQKALVAQAEKNLADTKIIAPITGRVSQRNIELGSFVQPGQQILALVGEERWIVANYKETQLENMVPGQKADVTIDAYPGKKYAAHVDSIQRGTGARFSAFPAENATGNFVKIVQRVPVKLLFDDAPDAALPIGPGMSVVPTVYTR